MSSTNAIARRMLLERIYDKMTDEEKRIFAMMTMQFLATGLNFFQVTNVTYLKDIVWGAVLIIVMTINHFQDLKHAKAA